MANQAPLYKFNQLPKALTTDVQSAYFGAQAQKNRRASVLDTAKLNLDTGKINLDSFEQTASRVLGNAVGLPERLGAIDLSNKALNNAVQTEYNSLTDQYNQGQVGYEDYLKQVQALGLKTTKNITNDPDYIASTNAVDDLKIGDYTVKDIINGVNSDRRLQKEKFKADDYAKGKISFEEYATFLKNELNYYVDSSTQDRELGRIWEDAYSTELGRYYNEIVAKHDAGQMTEPEYADFLKWYASQVDQGAQQTTDFEAFTPGTVDNNTNESQESTPTTGNDSDSRKIKDITTLSRKDLDARITKQENKSSRGRAAEDTEAVRTAEINLGKLNAEVDAREKAKSKNKKNSKKK